MVCVLKQEGGTGVAGVICLSREERLCGSGEVQTEWHVVENCLGRRDIRQVQV